MPRALLRMLIYKDDFEEYIDFLRTAKCKSIPVYATVLERQDGRNDLRTQLSLKLIFFDDQYSLYIENFETISEPYYCPNRNKGYGTFLLANLARRFSEVNFSPKITKIEGKLVKKDKKFWSISLPMYIKFAERIFSKKPIIKINDRKELNLSIKKKIIALEKTNDELSFSIEKRPT